MIKAFYATRQWALWAYGGGLLLISSLWLQVQMTVALNTWYGQFYDLLQNAASYKDCLLYTSPSPRDLSTSRMPSSA